MDQLGLLRFIKAGHQPGLVGHVISEGGIDQSPPLRCETHDLATGIVAPSCFSGDQSTFLEPTDLLGDRAGGDHGGASQLDRLALTRPPGPTQGTQQVELGLAQPMGCIDLAQALCERTGDPMQPPDHCLRAQVHIRTFAAPLLLDAVHVIRQLGHDPTLLASMEATIASMEAISARDVLTASFAPLAWGSTYFVTRNSLPTGIPLTAAALRAAPAGLLLMMVTRRLPHGQWWWKTTITSMLSIGGFFVCVYVAGTRLPSAVAATIMATSALAMMVFGRLLLDERPSCRAWCGAIIGIAGVWLLVGAGRTAVDPVGLAASLAAMISSSLGFVLTKRWQPPAGPLTYVAWQLTLAGLSLAILAAVVEGTPPPLTVGQLTGFAYISLMATAVAYVCWFHGLQRLPASAVGVIGLLNPIAGAILGTLVAGEILAGRQLMGLVVVIAGIMTGLPRAR